MNNLKTSAQAPQKLLPSLRDGPRPENHISYSIHKEVHYKTDAGLPARRPSPPLKSAAAPAEGRGTPSLLMMGVVTTLFIAVGGAAGSSLVHAR